MSRFGGFLGVTSPAAQAGAQLFAQTGADRAGIIQRALAQMANREVQTAGTIADIGLRQRSLAQDAQNSSLNRLMSAFEAAQRVREQQADREQKRTLELASLSQNAELARSENAAALERLRAQIGSSESIARLGREQADRALTTGQSFEERLTALKEAAADRRAQMQAAVQLAGQEARSGAEDKRVRNAVEKAIGGDPADLNALAALGGVSPDALVRSYFDVPTPKPQDDDALRRIRDSILSGQPSAELDRLNEALGRITPQGRQDLIGDLFNVQGGNRADGAPLDGIISNSAAALIEQRQQAPDDKSRKAANAQLTDLYLRSRKSPLVSPEQLEELLGAVQLFAPDELVKAMQQEQERANLEVFPQLPPASRPVRAPGRTQERRFGGLD